MVYLLLSILSSTLIVLILKLFERFRVNNLEAIVINYFIAAGLGFLVIGEMPDFGRILSGEEAWIWVALILGSVFVVLFLVMTLAVQKVGIAPAAIANNVSMVIPVTAAVLLYGDTMPWLKIVGIVLAIVGLYYATKIENKEGFDKRYLYFPIILFLGSGTIQTLLNYTQVNLLPGDQAKVFVPFIFAISAVFGVFIFAFSAIRKKHGLSIRGFLAGLSLGIANYASVYFLIRALEEPTLESSVIFPVNNMAIVALSAVAAFFLFREKLSKSNVLGIVICIVAIGVITFHDKIIPV